LASQDPTGGGPAVPSLFTELPAELAAAFDPERPWELLGEPLDAALALLPSSRLESKVPPEAHLVGDRVVLARGVRVHPGAVIEGPVFIGEGAEIRPGSYIRGGAWIGAGCVVGASTELKRAILLPGAKAPHLNYVGDSILGAGTNLGAGTILSNFRHDGAEILIPCGEARVATGRRKLGALLGDGVLTGCNCVLHPGVVMGRGSQIYPGVNLRPGFYPADHVVKLRQQLEVAPLRDS
jgi:UDP-N-acetylglucosamine diphosphorylase / glucose-1-phosphate thymidylyltransferase / UDP-N-acetylgalactosamine diphosphorylase / glucosamine-1-phosphate N-acetyltransferase / galactosamine-1-phosphate N-acetyltransferase